MENFYQMGELKFPSQENKLSSDTHLYGFAWEAWLENDNFYLQYISGEHAGRLKKIQISLEEFENLKHGKTTDAAILLAHGAY